MSQYGDYLKTMWDRWQLQRKCDHRWMPIEDSEDEWQCQRCGKLEAGTWLSSY